MSRRPARREPPPDINERLLRFKELRVIGSDGAQMGVVDSRSAVEKARDEGLDLVLVAPNADPPVARIVDHGKYKYEQSKLGKDKKPKKQEVKGIKVSPTTAEHDLQVSTRAALRFLGDGHKVRLVCRFRRRQLEHPEIGRAKLNRILELIGEAGKPDREPVLSGQEMVVVVNPKVVSPVKKNVQTEDTQNGGEAV
ncbi:MAG: translation initiation factor IF-3 [Fimbriimonadaceae bacterium]|nr:translation initiation factor IF-3 [Fimbriimonadaceae bacterium]